MGLAGLIAIVEDEPELQALYRLILASKGYEIAYISANADDAVEKYARCARKPDLVIMDRRLEGSSGVDAARRILEADPAARILFATADADRDLPSGPSIAGVLQKPFSVDLMLRAIRRALEESESSQTVRRQVPSFA